MEAATNAASEEEPQTKAAPLSSRPPMRARTSWRPSLRLLVVSAALTIVVGMAISVASIVANQLRQTATLAAQRNVETLVRGFVNPTIGSVGLDLDAPSDAAMADQLERIVA